LAKVDRNGKFHRSLISQYLLGCGIIALMMEAARSSETLVNFNQTTWRYDPEDSHPRDFDQSDK
jgi:hypothetical protein